MPTSRSALLTAAHDVRVACRPFLTRAFRGRRGRRFGALSVVFAAITVLLSAWLTLGAGPFERGIRESLGFEPSRWSQQFEQHLVFADDVAQYRSLERDRALLLGAHLLSSSGDEHQLYWETENARREVANAAVSAAPAEHAGLQARAVARAQLLGIEGTPDTFYWLDSTHVTRLTAILDHGEVPRVVLYHSPLTGSQAVAFAGWIAGGVLLVLLLFVAPLIAAVAVAQEVHENTLPPLRGTALSARQLALGLSSGPFAQAGVLAMPQLVLFGVAATLTGEPLVALGFVAATLVSSLLLTVLAQLMALALGRKRTPGFLGISLAAVLGLVLCFGLAFVVDVAGRWEAAILLAPQTVALHLLGVTFDAAFAPSAAAYTDFAGLGRSTAAFAILALLGALAFERRLWGRRAAPLRAREAFVGAAVVGCALLGALDEAATDLTEVLSFYPFLLLAPLCVLLMARIPQSDEPTPGRPPVGRLLVEFAGFWAVAGGLALLLNPPQVDDPRWAGLLHALWAIGTAGLLSIRSAALPMRPAATAWVGFGVFMVLFELGTAGITLHESSAPLFPLWQASPVLAVLHLTVLAYVPFSLWRCLSRPTATG